MTAEDSLRDGLLAAWCTNARLTTFLIEHQPAELWPAKCPERRSGRSG